MRIGESVFCIGYLVFALIAGIVMLSRYDGNQYMLYAVMVLLDILAVVRIGLCLVSSNRWFDGVGDLKWAIIRNVPFVIMGILMVGWLLYGSIVYGWGMYLLSVLIILSFGFYIPVVLFARKKPMVGMLEMVTSVARSDDYENRDGAEGILWYHSCGAHTKAENWVINKFN